MDCIFCKIINKEIPKEFTYEDEHVVVFPDIHPIKPIHLLVIPKEHISELVEAKNPEIVQKLFTAVNKMITEQGLVNKGYRVVINGGGAQMVPHLHIHVVGPITQTAKMG